MSARTRFLLLMLPVLSVDQVTKALVADRLTLGESVPIVGGLLHFTLVRNTGMAFGLLAADTIPHKPLLMTLLSITALAAVTIYAVTSSASERLSQFALALILGGAAGNIVDRIRLGYVIDFIDVFYRGSHWPAFNVADTAISVGALLLLLDTLLRRESPHPNGERASA